MTRLGLIDTHAHLMDARFDADRGAVVQRARQAGVGGLMLVGDDLPTSRAAIDLSRDIDDAWPTVGIHPNAAASISTDEWRELESLAQGANIVAVGETGLAYYRDWTPHDQQRVAFERHLRLAERLGVPVVVHNRDADGDVGRLLEVSAARRASGTVPGLLHCFSSTDPAYLQRMLDLGYFVSMAGQITFKNAGALRAIAATVPLARLLVETDCPYLAPVPHRGQRNEPAFVRDTAALLASLHGLSLETLAERLWHNSVAVFPALAEAQFDRSSADGGPWRKPACRPNV